MGICPNRATITFLLAIIFYLQHYCFAGAKTVSDSHNARMFLPSVLLYSSAFSADTQSSSMLRDAPYKSNISLHTIAVISW